MGDRVSLSIVFNAGGEEGREGAEKPGRTSALKVCMVCPEIGRRGGSAFIGGGVNSVVCLSKGLADRGHQITIITTPHRFPGNHPDNGLDWAEVVCLPVSGTYLSFRYSLSFVVRTVFEVRRLHRIKKFDIIHVHSGFSVSGLITAVLRKITGIPAVHTLYCPLKPHATTKKKAVTLFSSALLVRFYLRRIDKIMAISKNVSDSLALINLPAERISVIPPGIDLATYNPRIKSKMRDNFGITPDQPVLLYIGNLNERKGILILIEALRIVVERFPAIRLFMVLNIPVAKYQQGDLRGAQDDMELVDEVKEKINSSRLESSVIPLGITPNMPEVMAASDVLIVPFLDTVGIADYPISALEAMACGKPVIATKVGGLPEVVRHQENGLLINPGDSSELAEAIGYMLSNRQEAKRMGMEGAKLISRDFSTEVIVDRMERTYEELSRGE